MNGWRWPIGQNGGHAPDNTITLIILACYCRWVLWVLMECMVSGEKMHSLIKLSTSTAPCKGILLESETLSFAEQGCSCPNPYLYPGNLVSEGALIFDYPTPHVPALPGLPLATL